jgi:hypothetical protein
MRQTDALIVLFTILIVLTLAGVTAATLLAIRPWAIVYYCVDYSVEVLCFSEPRWRVLWDRYYSPWCHLVPLIALVLYVLWHVAGWMDDAQAKHNKFCSAKPMSAQDQKRQSSM